MKVCYDRKNDIVSVYFEDERVSVEEYGVKNIEQSQKEYSFDEVASLILDMVDIIDENGSLLGFRVFNASNYYDVDLLNSADYEELDMTSIKRPQDKVIARVSAGQIIY
ncbi:MAG: hypothetical protein N2594_00100 [Clostridiales bacterium]|nr:hypothetical protein [Clostridiales bacterium]